MTSLFYVALTDGTTTLELTDGVNFSISDESGWLPNIAFDTDQRTVVDSIPINILGAASSGGRSQAGKTRVNYVKLLAMLRQIERGQQGDGGVVTLIYTSPNSAPARRIACQVTRWDPSTFPADISSVINLPQNEINEVVLTLEHRVPWVWQSYIYENLLASSEWYTAVGVTGVNGTAAWVGSAGAYGGLGLIRLTHTIGGTSSIYPATTIAVTNGVPVTVTWTAGWVSGIQSIRFVLIESGTVNVTSSDVTQAVSGSATMAEGRRFTATVTPTVTGNVRLFWQMLGNNGNITEIAEVFVHATVAETWHLNTVLEGAEIATASSAAHPINRIIEMAPTSFLADTKLAVTGIPQGGLSPTGLGGSFTCIAPAASILLDYPKAAPAGTFTTVADVGRLSYGGNVMRFTPAVAGTVYLEPLSATPMLTSMAATIDKTRELQIVLVLVNNSATATFSIYVTGVVTAGRFVTSRTVDIPPNGADPIHVLLPTIYSEEGFYDFWLYFSGSVAGQTLDVDRVYALGVNQETSMVLTQTNYSLTNNNVMTFDPQTLTRPKPVLVSATSAGGRAILRTSDVPLLTSRSTNVRVIVDGVSDGLWQYASAGAVTLLECAMTRPPAFDAPL